MHVLQRKPAKLANLTSTLRFTKQTPVIRARNCCIERTLEFLRVLSVRHVTRGGGEFTLSDYNRFGGLINTGNPQGILHAHGQPCGGIDVEEVIEPTRRS